MKKILDKNIEQKDWSSFRKTGLFMFVNTILHAFGWVLVISIDDETKEVTEVFPARTKYRGFDNKDQDEMHTKIADYLAETAVNFPKEIQ